MPLPKPPAEALALSLKASEVMPTLRLPSLLTVPVASALLE